MPIKRVFSAGGIVVREFEDDRRILVTQHSKHKGWDFPKGHLESGESAESAALREVEEETGVKGVILEKVGQTQYFYWDSGEPSFKKASSFVKTSEDESEGRQKVFKTVTFFLMKYVGDGEATTAFEVSDMKWLTVDKVEDQLTFKDTKELWQKARSKIEQLTFDN